MIAALTMFALMVPGNAQFWGDSWGGRQQPQQRQQPYNPFGGFWGDRPGGFWGDRQRESPRSYPRQRERVTEPEREEPPDYSHAPPATPRKDATIKIVVMGGYVTPGVRQELSAWQIESILPKPFSLEDIEASMKACGW